jgi:hypothetical protein
MVELAIANDALLSFEDSDFGRDRLRNSKLDFLELKASTQYKLNIKNEKLVFEPQGPDMGEFDSKIEYHGLKYTPIILDKSMEKVEVSGYFQSPKFFQNSGKYFCDFLKERVKAIELPFIKNVIQFRLGDMASSKKTSKFHGYCGDDYWLPVLENISLNAKNCVVITDDKKHLNKFLPDTNKLISQLKIPVSERTDLEDFALLRNAENRFISNSSFGWWASYLAEKGNTFVPNQWYKGKENLIADSELKILSWIYT